MIKSESENVPISEEDLQRITYVGMFKDAEVIPGQNIDGVYKNKDGSIVAIDRNGAVISYPDGRKQIVDNPQGLEKAKGLVDKDLLPDESQFTGILHTIKSVVIRTPGGDYYYSPKDNEKPWFRQYQTAKKKMTDEQKAEFIKRFPIDKLAEIQEKADKAAEEEFVKIKSSGASSQLENQEKTIIDSL